LNVDFGKNRYAILFDMYARFHLLRIRLLRNSTYRDHVSTDTNDPFVVIDCLWQNESIKGATVDVRIEFDCKKNVPANTTAYCLILHDRVIEYCPLFNVMRKIM